jgi:hypothetical protein
MKKMAMTADGRMHQSKNNSCQQAAMAFSSIFPSYPVA